MPAIRRSMHATRNRVDPLRRNNEGTTRPPPSRVTVSEMADGLVLGWQFKAKYEGSVVPEFPREPGPGTRKPANPRPTPLKLQDLECIKVLGGGGYGHVLLVRTIRNIPPVDKPGRLFAMKAVRKKYVRSCDENQPTEKDVERSTLCELPWNPFVNGIIQPFHDARNFYLMLELVPCGTLRSLIQKRAPLDPAAITFYFANIVCGLEFLEQYAIVHRDIKPDNILVGADGYLCLADFGTAQKAYQEELESWLMNGTASYMAPEVISPVGQTQRTWSGVDWWASGCVLYEMITKKMAFHGYTEQSTYKKSLSGHLDWPPTIRVGKKLKSLVTSLLTMDAAKRLGTQGASEVTHHPYLKNVSWSKMRLRQYLAPYVPPTPDLSASWHMHPMPEQPKFPDLTIASPPLHLLHDNRFPKIATS